MTGYVVVPSGCQKKLGPTQAWIEVALTYARTQPAKDKAKKPEAKKK